MTVSVISSIPIYTGPASIVTSITAPNIPGGGTIGIGDILGLQASLDAKIDDTLGVLGATNVITTGAELNFLSGTTSNVQTQIDGKVDIAGDTMTGSLIMDAGAQVQLDVGSDVVAEVTTIQTVADAADSLDGTYFDYDTPTNQYRVWLDTPGAAVAPAAGGRTLVQVVIATGATAIAVATAIAAAMDALTDVTAISGGTDTVTATNVDGGPVSDAVDTGATGFTIITTVDGTALIPSLTFDVDTDTGIWWPAANTIGFSTAGVEVLRILPSGLVQSQVTAYEALVVADNDIPNKKYVDDEIALSAGGPFLPLAGGIMTGDIDLNGVANIIIDADGDSYLDTSVANALNLALGGNIEFTFNTTTLSVGTKTITNVVDPIVAQDAATKNYVDTEITALGLGGATGPFLELAGGVMAGAINMGNTNKITNLANPTLAQDAVTVAYADATYVSLVGATGPLGGDLNMGGNTITNVADPTLAQDAATKAYVDGNFLDLAGTSAMTGSINMGANVITNLAAATANDEAVTLGQANTLYFRLDGSSAMTANANIGGFKLINVANPTLAQDAVTLAYGNANYIRADGTTPMAADLNMGSTGIINNKIINLTDPTLAQDAATKNYVDTEITALNLGGTGPFLQLSGGTMTGAIDMGTNLINNVVDPVGAQDAATKNYVDTEISDLNLGGTGPFLELAGGTMTGDLALDANVQVLADDGIGAAPGYAFVSDPTSGMYLDGTNIRWSLASNSALTISPSAGANEVDVHGRRVTGVADPTDPTDAVTKNFFDNSGMIKVLGQANAVDLMTLGSTSVYTVPAGVMQIVTHVLFQATSYNPGAAPTNPEISVGTSGPNFNNIVADNTELDWGGIAGAADQVVYVSPKNGATSPNAADVITVQVDTAAAGDFVALEANVIVLGIEL